MTVATNSTRTVLSAAIMLLVVNAAHGGGEIVQYYASSGLLPSSSVIPESQRFTQLGRGSLAAMGPGELHITDDSTVHEIKYVRTPTVLRDQNVVLELTARVLWADRDHINLAGETAFHDDLRFIALVLCPDRVGFQADIRGNVWLASYAMDTTDAYHDYRIVKSGQDVVELFIDDSPTPLLSANYEDFPLKDAASNSAYPHGAMIPWQGSNQGLGEVSITYFGYNTDGTVIPEPATMGLMVFGAAGLLRRRRRGAARTSRPTRA